MKVKRFEVQATFASNNTNSSCNNSSNNFISIIIGRINNSSNNKNCSGLSLQFRPGCWADK